MTTTYPKAKHLSLGYDPKEDRLILSAHLQDGNTCKVIAMGDRTGSLIDICLSIPAFQHPSMPASTHPAAAHSPNPDEVLQMEHVASVQGSKSEKGEQATEQESIPTYLATSAQKRLSKMGISF